MKLNPDWLSSPQTKTLIKAFAGQSEKIRFVGGAIRDYLLETSAQDVDVATTLLPQDSLELLQKSGIRAIPTGIKHGTITAVIDSKNFEITTLRRDVACDGRHADVEFTDDWREDAARRDFTMNALYLSVDGELFDYFGGVDDTRAGRVCFIGDARDRIAEDYLRILRFFRFFAYYGKGEADKTALAACTQFASEIKSLSGERIQHEMLKLLAAPAPFVALELMQNTGVLEQVCGFKCRPLSSDKFEVKQNHLRLALLILSAEIPPTQALELLSARWKLSSDLKKSLLLYISRIHDISPSLSIAQQKHLIRTLGAEDFSSLVLLKMALKPDKNYIDMQSLAASWEIPVMPINGSDLIEAGIKEGKELGEKLSKLEKLWEESDYKLTKEELKRRI